MAAFESELQSKKMLKGPHGTKLNLYVTSCHLCYSSLVGPYLCLTSSQQNLNSIKFGRHFA